MGRELLYGLLGAVFGFLVGAISLSTFAPSSANASGPNDQFIFFLVVFIVIGVLLGGWLGHSLNSRYGLESLKSDPDRPKIEAAYLVLFGVWPAVLIPLALTISFLIGGKIPPVAAVLYPAVTLIILARRKRYRMAIADFPGTSWLRQSQYRAAVDLMLYAMPIGSLLIITMYILRISSF